MPGQLFFTGPHCKVILELVWVVVIYIHTTELAEWLEWYPVSYFWHWGKSYFSLSHCTSNILAAGSTDSHEPTLFLCVCLTLNSSCKWSHDNDVFKPFLVLCIYCSNCSVSYMLIRCSVCVTPFPSVSLYWFPFSSHFSVSFPVGVLARSRLCVCMCTCVFTLHFVWTWWGAHHSIDVEVGELVVGSLLLLCGPHGSNLNCLAWPQVPFPTQPSRWTMLYIFFSLNSK